MTLRRLTRPVVLVAVALLAASAHAEPPARARLDARAHLERGEELYSQGRYADAVGELKVGWAIDPLPDFLYALGQAERKRGDCRAAVGYYQRFLDTGPSSQRAVAVLMQIDRCKQELATVAPVTPQPRPPSETPPAVAPPSETPPAVAPPSETPPAVAPPSETPPAAAPPAPAVAAEAPARTAADQVAATPPARKPLYRRWWLWTAVVGVAAAGVGVGLGLGLTQHSFNSTLPDLVIPKSSALVRF